MQPVRRTQGFTNGEASFGSPPGGFVWSVQLNVPTAANSDTFQLYINGEQLTSTTGTGLMGPVQVFSGETITIKSSSVAAGTKAFLYGQLDKMGQQPSGIFPAISGGVVTTSSGYPLSTPLGGTLVVGGNVFPTLEAGTWLVHLDGQSQSDTNDAAAVSGVSVSSGTAPGFTQTGSGGEESAVYPPASGYNVYANASYTTLVTITGNGTITLGWTVSGTGGSSSWTATRVA